MRIFLGVFVMLCFIMLFLFGLSVGISYVVKYFLPKVSHGEAMIYSLMLLITGLKVMHTTTRNMEFARISDLDWEEASLDQRNYAKRAKKRRN